MAGLGNSFAAVLDNSNSFTRKFGDVVSAVDAYVSGYHFIQWGHMPPALSDYVAIARPTTSPVPQGESQIASTLQSLLVSVNIPGATVNKTELTGLGGIRWGTPLNVEQDNAVTMRFYELSGIPVYHIIHGWVRMIRDYKFGVSSLTANTGNFQYTKSNYNASCYIWTTKPNGLDIEYSALATGMFPARDPSDVFSSDLATNDRVEIDIEFNCDYLYHEKWVETSCAAFAASRRATAIGTTIEGGGTVDGYGPDDGA